MQIDDRVTGKTRLAGLIGNPVGHSISPQLHNSLSRHLGMDLMYLPFKVDKGRLKDAVKGLIALDFIGFNITIPFKQDVIELLDEVSREALLLGAVNTVKIEKGKLIGTNTDADGFMRSFREETGTGLKGRRVMVLGAGGAARAIAFKAAFEGAEKVFIANRTKERADELAELINKEFPGIAEGLSITCTEDSCFFKTIEVIIQTTPAGMHPDTEACPVSLKTEFTAEQIVYDTIYNPAVTKLMQRAGDCGAKTVNGLGMLIYQGVSAFEIWTGQAVPDECARSLYEVLRGC